MYNKLISRTVAHFLVLITRTAQLAANSNSNSIPYCSIRAGFWALELQLATTYMIDVSCFIKNRVAYFQSV
jgi:hypothetical protein